MIRNITVGLSALLISSAALADENENQSPAQGWEGLYLGISATSEDRDYLRWERDDFAGLDGFSGGAQAGYRLAFDDRIVVGGELAAYVGNTSASESGVTCLPADCGWQVFRTEERSENFGVDLLIEAGVTVGENYLVSVVAGPAWAQYEYSYLYENTNNPNEPDYSSSYANTTNMVGLAYGARLSRQFGDNWSLEAQCLAREFSGDHWEDQWRGQTNSGGESAGGRSCSLRLNLRR